MFPPLFFHICRIPSLKLNQATQFLNIKLFLMSWPLFPPLQHLEVLLNMRKVGGDVELTFEKVAAQVNFKETNAFRGKTHVPSHDRHLSQQLEV